MVQVGCLTRGADVPCSNGRFVPYPDIELPVTNIYRDVILNEEELR